MSKHHLHIVLAKELVEVECLHIVLPHGVGGGFLYVSVLRGRGSVEGVAVDTSVALSDIDVVVGVKLQPFGDIDIDGEGTGE